MRRGVFIVIFIITKWISFCRRLLTGKPASVGSLAVVSAAFVAILAFQNCAETAYKINQHEIAFSSRLSVASLDEGKSPQILVIPLSKHTVEAMTAEWEIQPGPFGTTADFAQTRGTVEIPSHHSELSIGLEPLVDTLFEASEEFTMKLTMGADTFDVFVVMKDSLPPPELRLANIRVQEGLPIEIPVTLEYTAPYAVVVPFSTKDITARAMEDYLKTTGNVVIDAGSTSATILVMGVQDLFFEGDEMFSVSLIPPNTVRKTADSVTVVIEEDDLPPTLNIAAVAALEGIPAVFQAVLSAPARVPVSFTYATRDGSAHAPDDYRPIAVTTVQFLPGEWTKSIQVATTLDAVYELEEDFFLDISGQTNTLNGAPFSVRAALLDKTGPPSVMTASVTVPERQSAVITFSLSHDSTVPVSFAAATANGTAVAPGDFPATNQYVQIPAGQRTAMISIPANGDGLDEDDEAFKLNLSNPVNAVLMVTSIDIKILDQDVPPLLTLMSESAPEISGMIAFQYSLSEPSAKPISFRVQTQNGTAIAIADYAALYNVLISIPPGSSQGTITVSVVDDNVVESTPETFRLIASGFLNLSNTTSITATGTIVDPVAPELTIANASLPRGFGDMTFRYSLSRAYPKPVSFRVRTLNGTANAPSDYVAFNNVLITVPAGTTEGGISVTVVDDRNLKNGETSETFTLRASQFVNMTNVLPIDAIGTIY
jgi:hypothetical protein